MKNYIRLGGLLVCLIAPALFGTNKKEYATTCVSSCKSTINSAIACLIKKTDTIVPGKIDDNTDITGTIKYEDTLDNNGYWCDTITFSLAKKIAPATSIGSIEIRYKSKPNIFYIADLAIDKDHQNQGLGSVLLTLALELAKAKPFTQYRDLEVNLIPAPTNFDKKETLIKYYKSFGFGDLEPDGRQRLYIKKTVTQD